MYVVKLPYGLRQEGGSERLVHISEIIPSESGLRCRCVCPSCGVRLQAKLPKTRKDFTPRFAHHRGDECEYAVETALHLKAKEIIEEEKQLHLPSVIASYEHLTKEVTKARMVTFDYVILEHRVDDIRPDILAYKHQRPLMIEVKVTHGIDKVKYAKIVKLDISTLEIDLSSVESTFDPDWLRNQIIHATDNKQWVYNTLAEKERAVLKQTYQQQLQEEALAEQKAEEQKQRLEKINAAKRQEKAKRIEALLDPAYQATLRQTWAKTFEADPLWKIASNGMNLSSRKIPEYLNIPIPGEIVFGCDRRVWQSYLFYRHIYNKIALFKDQTYPVSVKYIQKKVKTEFKDRLLFDLVYTKDIPDYRGVPDLTQVIYHYLKKVEEYGYLRERESGHPYYAKFTIQDLSGASQMRTIPSSLPEYAQLASFIRQAQWEDCIEFIQDLLVQYQQSGQIDYFDRLIPLFNWVVERKKCGGG